jgi:hypothetical protein
MVTKLHKNALQSEIASLRGLLDRTAGRDKLGSISLKQRLDVLERQLVEEENEARNTANIALVFDGGPVRGSSAIDADFAGKVLQEYQELVAKQVTVASVGWLAQRGPLPAEQQKRARLNITGIVHGSFGFVLEEDNSAQAQMFASSTMQAVMTVTDIINGVSVGDNKWFDNALTEMDVRVFQSLKRFLSILYKSESSLKMSEESREVKLGVGDVHRAYLRISQTDIEESEEEVTGELLGLAPIQRRFDFKRDDDESIVSGMVSVELSADYLERLEREGLVAGGSWRARLRTKTVKRADGRNPTITSVLVDLERIDSQV